MGRSKDRGSWTSICVVLWLALSAGFACASGDVPRVIFAVVPSLTPEKLVSTYEPLVDFIASRCELSMRIETAPDYREFARRSHEEKRYDFILAPPHLTYLSSTVARYRPVARAAAEPLRALLVTRSTSEVRTLNELRGQRLAIPDEMSVITILTRGLLVRSNINFRRNIDVIETPTVDAAMHMLFSDRVDVAAVSSSFYRSQLFPLWRDQLRVVAESEAVPQLTISVAPWISPAVAEQVTQAVMAMHETVDGEIVLRKMGVDGFVPASANDYQTMRALMRFLEY